MRLLAIDPGSSQAVVSHTGIVLLDYDQDNAPVLIESWAVTDGINGFRSWYELEDFYTSPGKTVVCEQFVNRNIPGADLSPLLIEGAVRFLYPSVVLQTASGKNTAVSDEALNSLGFTKTMFGADHHADRWEALRHAVWYLKKQRHRPTILTGWS